MSEHLWAHCGRCLKAGRPFSSLMKVIIRADDVEIYCAQCGTFTAAADWPDKGTVWPHTFSEGLPGEETDTLHTMIDLARTR